MSPPRNAVAAIQTSAARSTPEDVTAKGGSGGSESDRGGGCCEPARVSHRHRDVLQRAFWCREDRNAGPEKISIVPQPDVRTAERDKRPEFGKDVRRGEGRFAPQRDHHRAHGRIDISGNVGDTRRRCIDRNPTGKRHDARGARLVEADAGRHIEGQGELLWNADVRACEQCHVRRKPNRRARFLQRYADRKDNLVVIAEVLDAECGEALRRRPLEIDRRNILRSRPVDLRRKANFSGRAPVGLPALGEIQRQPGRKRAGPWRYPVLDGQQPRGHCRRRDGIRTGGADLGRGGGKEDGCEHGARQNAEAICIETGQHTEDQPSSRSRLMIRRKVRSEISP